MLENMTRVSRTGEECQRWRRVKLSNDERDIYLERLEFRSFPKSPVVTLSQV